MLSKRSWELFSQCCKPRPQGRRFISSPSIDVLEKLGLWSGCNLYANDNNRARAAEGATLGGGEYMTSKEMYRHLNHIQGFLPPRSRPHFQMETIIFRASATLQDGRCMVLRSEDGAYPLEVPLLKRSGTRKLSGIAGYSVDVASSVEEVPMTDQFALVEPWVEPRGLFIARSEYAELWGHYPHAIAKMYAMAKRHEKKIIRGAVSDGYEWAFIILELNENGKGGFYRTAQPISIGSRRPGSIENPWPDVVAGSILAHWVQHCYDGIDEKDWFWTKDIFIYVCDKKVPFPGNFTWDLPGPDPEWGGSGAA